MIEKREGEINVLFFFLLIQIRNVQICLFLRGSRGGNDDIIVFFLLVSRTKNPMRHVVECSYCLTSVFNLPCLIYGLITSLSNGLNNFYVL